ncbi:putative Integral membrane protein [Seiridium cardinale]
MDPENTPALEAPEGETSNLIDPFSLKHTRYAVCGIGLGVVTLLVPTRIYVRLLVKKFNIEDWALIFAATTFAVLDSMLIIVAQYGDGTHQWNVSVANLEQALYYENIAEIFYCITMIPIKYVVLHQVKSIFFAHDRASIFHKIITMLILANFLLYLAVGLAFVFACTPREKIYHPMVEGRCISQMACMSAVGGLNIASDLSILVIPLFGISRLQMPLKKKLLASSVFGFGIFATAAATIRFYYGLQLANTTDNTWAFMPIGNWTSVEFMTGFIVACAPYIPRFVDQITGKKRSSPAYPSYGHTGFKSSVHASKNLSSIDRPDASFTALNEPNDMAFDDSIKLDQARPKSYAVI